MGLRQWINQNQVAAGGIAAALVVVAIIFVVWEMTHSSASGPAPLTGTAELGNSYYSDDDGKTSFIDSVKKVTPFQHQGKPAVRAYVFKCGSSEIVGFLGRLTDEGRRLAVPTLPGSDDRHVGSDAAQPPVFEIKKPGDAKWVPLGKTNTDQWQEILNVKCPSGDVPISLTPGMH